ncbi:tetratricopeptide repeat protein [Nitratireductor sp. CAU 1489]|uniref:Tetratricopeptide repeat protein n=1 Tax=Nitratireductor arenosus TaxID=2682096 RepID=A0A844QEX7_9HYPH|nr:tetratricopeptide repeat protein [Nitratireductor arenosus]MVA98526.1 tetratricopeptide repeat protein [Nitratireductor arenosus]
MNVLIALCLALMLASGPAVTQDQGDVPALRARLFAELKAAPSQARGRAVEDAIWRMWMAQAPNEAIRSDVADAMAARERHELGRALDLLDGVVVAAPDYAEGWNQRAFIHFLKGNPDEALADIDRALALEPKHFGALSGKAIVLMSQGRMKLAQQALRRAVDIHPWLKERSLLLPEDADTPPPPAGDDI